MHQILSSLVDALIQHGVDLNYAKRELEIEYIRKVLECNNGNIGLSAKALGIHRNTLSRRIKELNVHEH